MKNPVAIIMALSAFSMSYASSLDMKMQAKGYSYAPSMDGKAPIYQALSLLEQ